MEMGLEHILRFIILFTVEYYKVSSYIIISLKLLAIT